jgi:hypothetical protein
MSTTPDQIDRSVNRTTAAGIIGIKPATLKKWAIRERGPSFIRLGPEQQSRTLYSVAEIERWKRDPAGYRWPAAKRRTKNERHR